MATQLKYMYHPGYFEGLCPVLKDCIPNFDCQDFIFRVFDNQWSDLELKQRVRHITRALHHFMPKDYPTAIKYLVAIAGALEKRSPLQGFQNIFLPDYVEVYGLEHPAESLDALGRITRLVSAEFAVRPFILRDPDGTMQFLRRWSLDANENVRRLASEGCRPRLPWGVALPMFKEDPSALLPILENLKKDASLYVRKSVANNLNDISKDHPQLVLHLAEKMERCPSAHGLDNSPRMQIPSETRRRKSSCASRFSPRTSGVYFASDNCPKGRARRYPAV